MTPQEKAKELVEKYLKDYGEKMKDGSFMLCIVSIGRAKQCALIAVGELIKSWRQDDGIHFSVTADYWQQVKQEILLL